MVDVSSTVTLNSHRLTYTASGHPDAPPLLMIHGWFSHRGVWRQTIEAFQESHYCVAVDLLGFGDSDKPEDGNYSIEAQGHRILQVADALGLDTFTLLGHSMGGQISLCIASMLAPRRVNRLGIVSGVVAAQLTPLAERLSYWQVALGASFPWLYDFARWLSRYRWYSYIHYRTWFYNMDALPFEDWEMDRLMELQPGIHVSGYKAGQAIHNTNLTAHLQKIAAPTLAIFGRQDGTVPVSDGYLIEQHVPNSQLVLIDQCGHFAMYEQPQQYLDALRAFLV